MSAHTDKGLPFKLEGTINADTGSVELRTLSDYNYYPENLRGLKARIKNKKFSFTGYLSHPMGFNLVYGDSYVSDILIIEAGNQTVTVNIDSNKVMPKVNNASTREYFTEYSRAFKKTKENRNIVVKTWDSLEVVYDDQIPPHILSNLQKAMKICYHESDQTLLEYAKTHPNSNLAFWKLISLLHFGYEPIFDSIFIEFSQRLKSSPAGVVYANKLKWASRLSIGKTFPSFPVLSDENKPSTTKSIFKTKFTLVDFWYTNCGPCLREIKEYKRLYKEYKGEDFEIIGISTDAAKSKEKWLTMIREEKMEWPQFWDKDGSESSKLSIRAFPTTFLVDNEGKILASNIRAAELEVFLKENIKTK